MVSYQNAKLPMEIVGEIIRRKPSYRYEGILSSYPNDSFDTKAQILMETKDSPYDTLTFG